MSKRPMHPLEEMMKQAEKQMKERQALVVVGTLTDAEKALFAEMEKYQEQQQFLTKQLEDLKERFEKASHMEMRSKVLAWYAVEQRLGIPGDTTSSLSETKHKGTVVLVNRKDAKKLGIPFQEQSDFFTDDDLVTDENDSDNPYANASLDELAGGPFNGLTVVGSPDDNAPDPNPGV